MRKGEEARRELIGRAAELFDSRGYESVSIKDIAESLGWAKSLFYYYCPGKDELVRMAADARADELKRAIAARIDGCEQGSVQRLSLALDCAGFWAGGDAVVAAGRLKRLYSPGSLPWRAYLRARITPELGRICNDIIAAGVKEYEMFTPYPQTMGEVAVDLTSDLSERLAPIVLEGGPDVPQKADGLLRAYRCAVERLMEAPFGSVRLVGLDFIRDTARALDNDITGGEYDETHAADAADTGDGAAGDAGGAG